MYDSGQSREDPSDIAISIKPGIEPKNQELNRFNEVFPFSSQGHYDDFNLSPFTVRSLCIGFGQILVHHQGPLLYIAKRCVTVDLQVHISSQAR